MHVDHLVWYNADLSQGREFFAGRMDAEPLYGGEHPGEATANAVLGLGPSTYLEILGRDTGQQETQLDPEVRSLRGAGLYHWAIGGIDLVDLADRATRAGLAAGPAVPGGRIKPDGQRLDWVCWGLRDHAFGALIPFFIDWRASEHPAVSAPRGGRLSSIRVFTPEAEQLRGIFWILGLAIEVVEHDVAGVVATLESSKGVTELTSFTPLPRGYVI